MEKQDLTSLYHCVFSLNYHLVMVTKYRRKCMTGAVLQRMEDICDHVAEKWGCRVIEFNGEPDHVHLLLSLTPKVAPSAFVNNLKTVTARLIRKEFKTHMGRFYQKPVFWSRSYCVISAGGAPLSVLKQYIEQQERP